MTLRRMVEELHESLPKISRTRLIFELNDAAYEYCQETGIITQRTQLALTDYSLEDTTDNYFEYDLPADVYQVLSVDEVFQKDPGFEIFDGKIRFNWLPQPAAGSYPIIHYTRVPAALVDLTDEPEFDTSLHRALLAFVRMQHWMREPATVQQAMFQEKLYRDYVRRGKQLAATFRTRNIDAVPYTGTGGGGGTAGNVVYGSASLVEGVNTITFPDAFEFASTSFRLALTGNGIDVQEYNKDTERTTTTFKVVSAADNANFEYIAAGPVTA